jgi:signal-transduction protein with cAMP-binding, CBS, and nucleotidyltransferase domain
MFIEELMQTAHEKLVTIVDDAKLIDAAKLLSAGTDLVIVCNGDGVLQGVVTKTDVVKHISGCDGAIFMLPVATVMTRDVASCRGSDYLAEVSGLMKQRHLKTIPVVDVDNRPLGVLTARVILRTLLGNAKYEESQLINYIDGLGYR